MDVKLAVDITSDASGLPTKVAQKIAVALPADFTSRIAGYGTCGKDTIAKEGPSACPANSILGTGRIAATPTALPTTHASTDKGVLINVGQGKLAFWWHIQDPVVVQGVFDGTLTTDAAPYGPVVMFDLTPIADGSASSGLEIRTNRMELNFPRQPASSAPATSAPKSKSTSKARAKKYRSCMRKARKVKGKKGRSRAERKCKKRYGPKKSHSRAAPRAAASAPASAFTSTGCTGGKWPFRADVAYKDKSKEQVKTELACSGTGSAGGGPAGGIPCIPSVTCPAYVVATEGDSFDRLTRAP